MKELCLLKDNGDSMGDSSKINTIKRSKPDIGGGVSNMSLRGGQWGVCARDGLGWVGLGEERRIVGGL